MVDINSTTWSTTDASNSANSPNGWNSTTTPAQVIPISQMEMGAIKRLWERDGPAITSTGSSNAYVYTPSNTSYPVSYVAGDRYVFMANFSNTGAATLNVNSLGAVAIKKNSSSGLVALSGTEIQSGTAAFVFYDGTSFELLNPIPAAVAGYLPLAGGSMTGAINFAQASNLASASTTNIGAAAGNYINITGTTGITAFDTVQAGTLRILNFVSSLTLTNNSTSLILPGAANITTTAGDVAEFISLGSGNWKCINYTSQVVSASSATSNGYTTLPGGVILQWGSFTANSSGFTNLSFPKTFPNAVFSFSGTLNGSSPIVDNVVANLSSASTSSIPVAVINNTGTPQTLPISWIATGN